VDTVELSFEHGVCKPAVKPFLAACDRLQVAPARTLMVGDNPLTDSGAVAAGMYVFLLPRPTATGPRGLHHVLSLVCPAPEPPPG
jgi:FMN phosphatase YigB (HAD superfamily)